MDAPMGYRVANPSTPNPALLPVGHSGHAKIMWDYKEYEIPSGHEQIMAPDIAQKFERDCPWVQLSPVVGTFASVDGGHTAAPPQAYKSDLTGEEFATQAELMAHIRDYALAQAQEAPAVPPRPAGQPPRRGG